MDSNMSLVDPTLPSPPSSAPLVSNQICDDGIAVVQPLLKDSPYLSSVTNETAKAMSPWAALFQSGATKLKTTLEHYNTMINDGIAEIPKDVISEGVHVWKDYVVGFFIEHRLPYPLVKEALAKQWKTKADYSMVADKDLFYFKFLEGSDRQQVLEIGSLFIAGKLFVVKPWSQEVEKQRKQVRSIPIWANLHNVPKELWTEKGLSYLASLLGKPICLDEVTAKKERLNFARVCVEVDLDFNFKTKWPFKMGTDDVRELTVEFLWKPSICSKCKTFGHTLVQCEKQSSNAWVPNRKFRRTEKGQPSIDGTQRANGKVPLQDPKAVEVTLQRKTNWVKKDKEIDAPTPVLSNRFQGLEDIDVEKTTEVGEISIVESNRFQMLNNDGETTTHGDVVEVEALQGDAIIVGESEQGDVVVVATSATNVEMQETLVVGTTVQATSSLDNNNVVDGSALEVMDGKGHFSHDSDETIHFQLTEFDDALFTIIYGVKFGSSVDFYGKALKSPTSSEWEGRFSEDPDWGTMIHIKGDVRKEAAVIMNENGFASLEHIKIHRPPKSLKTKFNLGHWGSSSVAT